jgi:hypothetical protein
MKEQFEKIITFSAAYDKRDPNPSKNYGIHGVEIRFVLKGKAGATQFVVYTDWYLPHVQREFFLKPLARLSFLVLKPSGADIGYHSPTPQYEGQTKRDKCEYLNGRSCYYDGSGLSADEFIPKFLAGGSDAVWKMLEKEYRLQFKEEKDDAGRKESNNTVGKGRGK